MNDLINYEAVYRTASATPGLVIICSCWSPEDKELYILPSHSCSRSASQLSLLVFYLPSLFYFVIVWYTN